MTVKVKTHLATRQHLDLLYSQKYSASFTSLAPEPRRHTNLEHVYTIKILSYWLIENIIKGAACRG